MSGLFQRALEYFNQSSYQLPPEETAGISEEDQKDIQRELDKIQEKNRIQVTPQTLQVKAAKKGVAFPLLVNLFAVLLLAGGGFALWTMFQRGQSEAAGETAAVLSAEGALIAELKKESEEALLQKNREIEGIQSRLQDIDRERRELQSGMDARIQAREQELRGSLEATLAAERERLRQQGASEASIAQRLAALEAERAEAFQRELEGFRAQEEQKRRQAEAALEQTRASFERDLAQASADRQKVLEDAQKRETELRSQLAAQTEALQQETAEARRRLSSLSEQREKESLAAAQLNGLYGRVKGDLQASRYEQALADLEAVRRYLDDPAVASLPAIRERREIELFVVDSISSLARSQMQKAATDTGALVAAVGVLTDLKDRVVQADELLRTGQTAQAEAGYREALALIPEVNRAHERLTAAASAQEGAREPEAAALQRSLEERTRELENLRGQLTSARTSVAGLQRAIQERDGQITALQSERDRLLASAGEPRTGAAGAETGADPAQVAALQRSLDEQTRELDGLRAQLAASGSGAAALQRTIQERDREIAALEAERDRLLASGGEAGTAQRSLEERAGDLERELAAKTALTRTLESEKAALQGQVSSLQREIEELKRTQAATAAEREAELQQKITRLERIETRYNQLVASYQDYARQEDALLRDRGQSALLESKLYLNAFLASGAESFPGLWERIKRYDEAFESAGRASALGDVNDILIELSLRDRADAQSLYLRSEKVRYRDNPQMLALLDELLRVVGR